MELRCPKCHSTDVARVRKSGVEYLLNALTLNRFEFRRYKCIQCLSESAIAYSQYRKAAIKKLERQIGAYNKSD